MKKLILFGVLIILTIIIGFSVKSCDRKKQEQIQKRMLGDTLDNFEEKWESKRKDIREKTDEIMENLEPILNDEDTYEEEILDEQENENSYDNEYSDGVYKVGTDIAEGEYVVFSDDYEYSGYFCLSEDANGDEIIANEAFDYNAIVEVKNGEFLELEDAYAIPIDEAEVDIDEATGLKVGKHIKKGKYKLIADDGEEAYYCIYSNSRKGDIKSNGSFKKQSYVTVEKGDYLILEDCHIE